MEVIFTETLLSIYILIEVLICYCGGLIVGIDISSIDGWKLKPKTILRNSFHPQIEIINCLDGVVNKYGKAVLIILSAPFLLPLNLLLLVVQIIGIIISAVCFVFVFIFKEKDK